MTDPTACRIRYASQLLADQVPVYAYEFDYLKAPYYFPKMPGFVPLAAHTIDIQFLFPLYHGGPLGIPHSLNNKEQDLSDQLVYAWTNFAWTGNPNGLGNSPWPVYKNNRQTSRPICRRTYLWRTSLMRNIPPRISATSGRVFCSTIEPNCNEGDGLDWPSLPFPSMPFPSMPLQNDLLPHRFLRFSFGPSPSFSTSPPDRSFSPRPFYASSAPAMLVPLGTSNSGNFPP